VSEGLTIDSPSPVSPRHSTSSKFHKTLSSVELVQIAELRAKGWSCRRIGVHLGRATATISEALHRPGPKQLLERLIPKAIQSWDASLLPASKKGNHLPAKDLLLHLGVIQPISAENGPQIAISVGLVLNTAGSEHNQTLEPQVSITPIK
jgi:lambda repressor-like predicted transcriptional regulator